MIYQLPIDESVFKPEEPKWERTLWVGFKKVHYSFGAWTVRQLEFLPIGAVSLSATYFEYERLCRKEEFLWERWVKNTEKWSGNAKTE